MQIAIYQERDNILHYNRMFRRYLIFFLERYSSIWSFYSKINSSFYLLKVECYGWIFRIITQLLKIAPNLITKNIFKFAPLTIFTLTTWNHKWFAIKNHSNQYFLIILIMIWTSINFKIKCRRPMYTGIFCIFDFFNLFKG